MVEREAVRLGVQFQVGGKWCSFVAAESNKQAQEEANIEAENWAWLEDEAKAKVHGEFTNVSPRIPRDARPTGIRNSFRDSDLDNSDEEEEDDGVVSLAKRRIARTVFTSAEAEVDSDSDESASDGPGANIFLRDADSDSEYESAVASGVSTALKFCGGPASYDEDDEDLYEDDPKSSICRVLTRNLMYREK